MRKVREIDGKYYVCLTETEATKLAPNQPFTNGMAEFRSQRLAQFVADSINKASSFETGFVAGFVCARHLVAQDVWYAYDGTDTSIRGLVCRAMAKYSANTATLPNIDVANVNWSKVAATVEASNQ